MHPLERQQDRFMKQRIIWAPELGFKAALVKSSFSCQSLSSDFNAPEATSSSRRTCRPDDFDVVVQSELELCHFN